MALNETLQAQGNWLFRWRSYLPIPVFVATGALVPLKGGPGGLSAAGEAWEWSCLAVSVLGLAIRAHTIGCAPRGTSGRNTGQQVAHTVNRTGLYSLVRHPLYVGNFLVYLGVVLYTAHPWFVAVSVLAFWLYYERIMYAEEAYLRQRHGRDYDEWAAATPAVLPRLRGWRAPELPFSPVTVVAEEYPAIAAVPGTFGLLRLLEAGTVGTHPAADAAWAALFALAAAFYLAVRFMKKRLKWFKGVSRR